MSAGNRGEWVMVPRSLIESAEAFIGVMCMRSDGTMPATIGTPLGVQVKVGEIYSELQAALASPIPPPSNGCDGAKAIAWLWKYIGPDPYARRWLPVARALWEMNPGNPPYPEFWKPISPLYAAAPQPSADRDAYEGAREDLLDWKCRALRAERTLRGLGYKGVDASEPPSASSAPEAQGVAIKACDDLRKLADALVLVEGLDGPANSELGKISAQLHGVASDLSVIRTTPPSPSKVAGKIDEAMVEQKARKIACRENDDDLWGMMTEWARDSWRKKARAALEAAGLGGAGGDGIPDVFSAYRTWPQDIRAKLSLHDLRRMAGWAPRTSVADWRIDTSAGGPILVYQDCSVIEGEQARYILGLIHADTNRAAQPSESEAGGQEGECPHEAWEENGGARRCSDCREYLGHAPAPAEGGR
jgi:hypothetical protein